MMLIGKKQLTKVAEKAMKQEGIVCPKNEAYKYKKKIKSPAG